MESLEALRKFSSITIKEIHILLEEKIGGKKWGSYENYLKANQSTGLEIFFDGRLYCIVHRGIECNSIVVPTTLEQIIKYGTVRLQSFPNRDFATALLWQFHGQPCEYQSKKTSGIGYPRL